MAHNTYSFTFKFINPRLVAPLVIIHMLFYFTNIILRCPQVHRSTYFYYLKKAYYCIKNPITQSEAKLVFARTEPQTGGSLKVKKVLILNINFTVLSTYATDARVA